MRTAPTMTAVPPGRLPSTPGRTDATLLATLSGRPVQSKLKSAPAGAVGVVREPPHLVNWVGPGRVDDMVRAHPGGQFQLAVVNVNGDDDRGAEVPRGGNGRQPDTAGAPYDGAVSFLQAGRVHHRAGSGHHRAADDATEVGRQTRRGLDYVLFVGEGVGAPGEDVAVHRRLPVGQHQPGALRRATGGAGEPGHQDLVAWFDVDDAVADSRNDAGRLVAEQQRLSRVGGGDVVELAVTDPGSGLLDHDLERARVGDGHPHGLEFPGRPRAAGQSSSSSA